MMKRVYDVDVLMIAKNDANELIFPTQIVPIQIVIILVEIFVMNSDVILCVFAIFSVICLTAADVLQEPVSKDPCSY